MFWDSPPGYTDGSITFEIELELGGSLRAT
jgi:hypothetical protein